MEKRKSRSIPLMDYYQILQFEFLSYFFRYLFYTREQDKVKYLDFCKKKKDSVEKLALRNNFKSIFNDEKKKEKYLTRFLNGGNLPELLYRDEYQKKHIGFWDKKYYFQKGDIIKYRDSDWEIVENVCDFNIDHNFIKITQNNKPVIKVHISEIKKDIRELFDFNLIK